MHQEARWKSFTIDTGPRPPEFPESMDIGEGYGRCIRFHSRGLSRVEEFRNAWGEKKKRKKKRFYDARHFEFMGGIYLSEVSRGYRFGQVAFDQSEICCSGLEINY